jgi:hypothetical protein
MNLQDIGYKKWRLTNSRLPDQRFYQASVFSSGANSLSSVWKIVKKVQRWQTAFKVSFYQSVFHQSIGSETVLKRYCFD